MKLRDVRLTSANELAALVREIGMIPVFRCPVEGFSVQDCTPSQYWFTDVEGPWEWRMELAAGGEFAYAKLFNGRAGLITMELYRQLANWRRRGYDFDALYDEGLAPLKHKRIIDALSCNGDMLSYALKNETGLDKDFEPTITKLQMQCYVTVKCFEYRKDRYGKSYGWGLARYDLSERAYGDENVTGAYDTEPEQSFELLRSRLRDICPEADEKLLLKLLK